MALPLQAAPLVSGEDAHDKLKQSIFQLFDAHVLALTPQYNRMVKHQKLYLADRPDRRLRHEKWRSWTWVPWPYVTTEAKVAAQLEAMNSSDPPVEFRGIGQEDQALGRKVEAYAQYTLDCNSWISRQEMLFRECAIQGTSVMKPVYRNRTRRVIVRPSSEEIATFDAVLNKVAGMPGMTPPDPVSQAEEFAIWRETVNRQLAPMLPMGGIPEVPSPRPREVVEYRGPWFDWPSLFDLYFDPEVYDPQDQPQIVHRVVKTREWLMGKTGDQPGQPYNPKQVEAALTSKEGGRFTQWDQEISDKLGIPRNDEDPLYQDAVELTEVWRPNAEYPYTVWLNRQACINKRPDVHPFWHGMSPYVFFRNVPAARRALGISEFTQAEKLFHDTNKYRDLWLDALTLSILPVLVKMKNLGLSDIQQVLQPGAVLSATNPQGINRLGLDFSTGLAQGLRADQLLKNDVDEAFATPPSVRGASATIGRVSATEHQARLQQALERTKQLVLRREDECNPLLVFMCYLGYQFGPEEIIVRVGGDENQGNPFPSVAGREERFSRDELLGAMHRGTREGEKEVFIERLRSDLKFRGATRALNRELNVQQLQGFLQIASSLQIAPGYSALFPEETRALLERIFRQLNQTGVSEVVNPARTQELKQAFQANAMVNNANTQLALANIQAQLNALLNPQPAPPQGQPGPEQAPPQGPPAEPPAQG
jgi:hypothetical protein